MDLKKTILRPLAASGVRPFASIVVVMLLSVLLVGCPMLGILSPDEEAPGDEAPAETGSDTTGDDTDGTTDDDATDDDTDDTTDDDGTTDDDSPPPGSDRDGDGLTYQQETDGWQVTVEDGYGETTTFMVSSDPDVADTDGDGLDDLSEYRNRTDPRKSDTDLDTLPDGEEASYGANPLDADSDDDARREGSAVPNALLFDGQEAQQLGTSPIESDTDGDGMSDRAEVESGATSPRLADVPQLEIEITTEPYVAIVGSESSGGTSETTVAETHFRRNLQTQSIGSRSTTQTVHEESAEISASVEGNISPLWASASAKVEGSYTTYDAQFHERIETFSSDSLQDAQDTYYSNLSEIRSISNTSTAGRITVGYTIRNRSDVTLDVDGLNVTVMKRRRESPGQLYGIVTFAPPDGSITVLPRADVGPFVVDATIPLSTASDLLLDGSSMAVKVAGYQLSGTSYIDSSTVAYGQVAEDVIRKTAMIDIDYGDGNLPERYLVRTNLRRDAAGRQAGISVQEALEIIREDGEGSFTYQTDGGVLYAVRGVEAHPPAQKEAGFWAVISSSDSLLDQVPFEEIVLKNGDQLRLVYVKDSDGDGLYDREERIIGSRPDLIDTDADYLSDYAEVREGWQVSYAEGYRTHSSPVSADADADGVTDSRERYEQTDPFDPDTDDDGLNDAADAYPTFPRYPVDVQIQSIGFDFSTPDLVHSFTYRRVVSGTISVRENSRIAYSRHFSKSYNVYDRMPYGLLRADLGVPSSVRLFSSNHASPTSSITVSLSMKIELFEGSETSPSKTITFPSESKEHEITASGWHQGSASLDLMYVSSWDHQGDFAELSYDVQPVLQ